MRYASSCIALLLLSLLATVPASANPTGAPLVFKAVNPCRAMDTRAYAGPIPASNFVNVYVRGSNLPQSQGGQQNCGIPLSAQAVLVNMTAVSTGGAGHILAGYPGASPAGNYSRLNWPAGGVANEELTLSLCNIYLHPTPHEPCAWIPAQGLYLDFQVGAQANPVHLIVDVIGYYEAAP